MSVKRKREKRAFQLILESGEEGILQSEIWKRLGANSQKGSIIAYKLERDGRIKRHRELHDHQDSSVETPHFNGGRKRRAVFKYLYSLFKFSISAKRGNPRREDPRPGTARCTCTYPRGLGDSGRPDGEMVQIRSAGAGSLDVNRPIVVRRLHGGRARDTKLGMTSLPTCWEVVDRWTYRLISLLKPITVDSITDCPCTACNDIDRCNPGLLVSPILCKKLTYWIDLNTDAELVPPEELYEDKM